MRNTLVATQDGETFLYTSFEEFCKAVNLDRKQFRKIPAEQWVEGHGLFKLDRLPLNVSMECHKLKRILKRKPAFTHEETAKGFEYTFAVNEGIYYIITTVKKDQVVSCKLFQSEIVLDEGTEEFILKHLS